jgi:hypothetical protein
MNDLTALCVDNIFRDTVAELVRAQKKFPATKHLLHAFVEEAGEVTKAYLDFHYKPDREDERYKELIQTMAMAMRLLLDGDPDFAPVPLP